MRFYKEAATGYWIVDERIGVPSGTCILTEHETNEVSIEAVDGRVFLSRTKVTNITKEDTTSYADIDEIKTVGAGFFIGGTTVTLVDENSQSVNVQNPLRADGDSVYESDVDFTCSVFTDWTGDTAELFKSPFSTSITNATSNNPKQITICFNRTVKALQIGLGENNGGDFSNVKITLFGSGGESRTVYDKSTDNTKRTSQNAELENELFNSALIEFYTADSVSLSNITIQKARYNTVQIQGKDDQTGKFEIASTSKGRLNVLANEKEYESYENKWGTNDDVDTGTTPETIWDGSSLYTYSNTAVNYSASSTDAGDSVNIEAELITVDGSGNYVEEMVTLTLNGQTSVQFVPPSGNLVIACNRAFTQNGVATVGDVYVYESSATVVGGIPTDATLIRAIFLSEYQQTRQTAYVLPDIDVDGNVIQEGHLIKWSVSVTKNTTIVADVALNIQENGKIMRSRDFDTVRNERPGGYDYGDKAPLKIPTKSRIEIRATNISVNDGSLTGKYQMQKVTGNEPN